MSEPALAVSATSPVLTIEGAIATIRFCNAQYANRLSPADLGTIQSHIHTINQTSQVLVLRFIADGKYFCSGYDISSLAAESAPSSLYFGETVDLIEQARPVTIAAINGGVYGGGTDLCLACDFRVGSTTANMFMPAAKLGLHFYPGGMVRYITRLGLNQAKRLFLTAEKIEASEMQDIGFLTELVNPEDLFTRVDNLSEQLASMAPLALLGIKKHLNLIVRGQVDQIAIEQAVLHSERSDDIKEGAAAWKDKRPAIFKGS
ncbi:MAG: enoyl-CoA hydratase/isomerase family protein [Burkholderiaceae bacterium]|nr:enoyl-CoA hydratase/isomerase family protein [Burkholderiaceae bacterium]